MTIIVNHCVPDGAGLSGCGEHESHEEQKTCFYYKKATHANRCMFLIFDEYCDHWGAQNDIAEIDNGD